MFYYKLGRTLLQIGAASLLQIRASAVKNWGNYYKLLQPLLQKRGSYYKLGQNVLQIGVGIINSGNYYKSGYNIG